MLLNDLDGLGDSRVGWNPIKIANLKNGHSQGDPHRNIEAAADAWSSVRSRNRAELETEASKDDLSRQSRIPRRQTGGAFGQRIRAYAPSSTARGR